MFTYKLQKIFFFFSLVFVIKILTDTSKYSFGENRLPHQRDRSSTDFLEFIIAMDDFNYKILNRRVCVSQQIVLWTENGGAKPPEANTPPINMFRDFLYNIWQKPQSFKINLVVEDINEWAQTGLITNLIFHPSIICFLSVTFSPAIITETVLVTSLHLTTFHFRQREYFCVYVLFTDMGLHHQPQLLQLINQTCIFRVTQ